LTAVKNATNRPEGGEQEVLSAVGPLTGDSHPRSIPGVVIKEGVTVGGDCCQVQMSGAAPGRCPSCGQPGRTIEPITVKAVLRPESLARLCAPAHRFCPTPSCPVVYFGEGEAFRLEDVAVPVFQKEPAGSRTVCYCFAVSEADLRREIAETGRSTAGRRITDHVQAGRCACEIKNPQGSCCLGNVNAAEKALLAEAAGTSATRGRTDPNQTD